MHPESRLSKFYDTLKTALVQFDGKEVGSMRLLTEEWLDAEMTRRVNSHLNLNLKVRPKSSGSHRSNTLVKVVKRCAEKAHCQLLKGSMSSSQDHPNLRLSFGQTLAKSQKNATHRY